MLTLGDRLPAGRLGQGERHVTRYHSCHYSYFAAARRIADVALQFGLGLLSLGRRWSRRRHFADPSADGQDLTATCGKMRNPGTARRVDVAFCPRIFLPRVLRIGGESRFGGTFLLD